MRSALLTALALVPSLLAGGVSYANYKNLKVLPADISERDLLATMGRMSQALGVQCTHCHVSDEAPEQDLKPAKDKARDMMRMTVAINRDWFPHASAPVVTCVTCHQGRVQPQTLSKRGPRPLPPTPRAALKRRSKAPESAAPHRAPAGRQGSR